MSQGRKLLARLRIVWENELPKRYIPRSLNGSTAWGVFDRKADKFIEGRDLMVLPKDNLLEVLHDA